LIHAALVLRELVGELQMATKSKAKAKKAKYGKTANSKKKKGKTRKGKAALTMGIGVISTLKARARLKNAFINGVNNANVTLKFEHVASYKRAKLKAKIEQFNADQQIGLIVMVGGLVAYEAANAPTGATKPFLALLGVTPGDANAQCYGGVSLDSSRSNPERIIDLVTNNGFSASEIGLFQNPNSAMQALEEQLWTGARPVVKCSVDANGDVHPATYRADIGQFPATVKAIVISADPFFQETMEELIGAANETGKYICYPLQAYENTGGTNLPTPGKAMLFGPSLVGAYKLLGQLSSIALNTGEPVDFSAVRNKKKVL
jgi:hypothetical protein